MRHRVGTRANEWWQCGARWVHVALRVAPGLAVRQFEPFEARSPAWPRRSTRVFRCAGRHRHSRRLTSD